MADDVYQVLVLATMSSGKSTLLNAMLGLPILPAKNKSCTSAIFKIEDIDNMKSIVARATNSDGTKTEWTSVKPTSSNILGEWNDSDVSLIEIQGDFPNIRNYEKRVSFFDTPGPNISNDKRHSQITNDILSKGQYSLIIYVMNATQFGVDDEYNLLCDLHKIVSKEKSNTGVIFVMNKIDQLNIDEGELPLTQLLSAKDYLQKIGFVKPHLIPLMSLMSLELRTVIEAIRNEIPLSMAKWKQRSIGRDIDLVLSNIDKYRSALIDISEFNRLPMHMLYEKIIKKSSKKTELLGDNKISARDLYTVDMMTGVQLLEQILESKLIKDVD